MADNDLSIRINTSADTSGVKQADDALDDLKKGADDASRSLDQTGREAEEAARNIDNAGASANKAGQELDRAEKEAREASTALNKAGRESGELKRELDDAAKSAGKASTELNRVDGSARRASGGKKDLADKAKTAKTETHDFGQAALNAAFFLDDLQYGIRGVVNNIPSLVQGLGLGAGAAGALGILAVALNQADQRLDLFGESLEDTAEKSGKLREEASKALAQLQRELRVAEDLKKAHDARLEQINAITEAYAKQTEAIDKATRAQNRRDRAELSKSDAEAALKLAEIESARVSGAITDEEAEERSSAVRVEADRRRFEVEQLQTERSARDARAKAEAEEARAREIERRLAEDRQKAEGLLTNDEREDALKKYETAGQEVRDMRNRLRRDQERRARHLSGDPLISDEEFNGRLSERALATRERVLKQRMDEERALRQRLDQDEEAKRRSGFGSREEFTAELKKLEAERKAALERAGDHRAEAGLLDMERSAREEAFRSTARRSAVESNTRREEIRKREEEQRRREEERRQREQERLMEEKLRAGARFMEDVRNVEGIDMRWADKLEEALNRRVAGDAAAAAKFDELSRLLIRRMEQEHLKTERLERSINELASRLKNDRAGR